MSSPPARQHAPTSLRTTGALFPTPLDMPSLLTWAYGPLSPIHKAYYNDHTES
jgi:hypothetical protein